MAAVRVKAGLLLIWGTRQGNIFSPTLLPFPDFVSEARGTE